MTTRMIHPKHGATHAYSLSEIAHLKASGWDVESPITTPVINGDECAPSPAEIIKEQRVQEPQVEKRRPGRPAKAK